MVLKNTVNSLNVDDAESARPSNRSSTSSQFPFTDFVAATPDARFIYDAVDAAKSLLSTFNSFVDPVQTFRYMPLRYYLYVIYSACFLYKARSTGVLGSERGSIKRMIADAVDRLQKASACANDVGDRYSRLIRLLWRKPPTGNETRKDSIAQPLQQGGASHTPAEQQNLPNYEMGQNPTSINAFSWLDLGAVGDFATNNNSIPSGSLESWDQFDEGSADGFSNFDPGMMDTQAFGTAAWNGISPPGIIF